MKTNLLNLYGNAVQKLATETQPSEHSAGFDGKRKQLNPTGASPADYPLRSPQSRAAARAWVEARNPGIREDLQRDEDALQLYEMIFELNGQVYPDWRAIQDSPIGLRGKELHTQKYGPIIPLHECPSWSRWARASSEFEFCFYREPKAGDLLRWEHVRTMRGPEMNEIKFRPQIEAWQRQLPDLPCPLKFENGRLFKRKRNGDWFEEFSVSWVAHWRGVECDAGSAPRNGGDGIPTQLGSDPDGLANTIFILAVTFLGVIDGKHVCRPATEQELQQPETDEFFRELWCKEPATDPPQGRVWIRNRRNGFYGTIPAADAAAATEGALAEYTRCPWPRVESKGEYE